MNCYFDAIGVEQVNKPADDKAKFEPEDSLSRHISGEEELDKGELLNHEFTLDEVEAILRWPWRPFCSPIDAAATELERLKKLGGLYPQYLLDVGEDNPSKIEERLRILSVRLFLQGHITSLSIAGGVLPLVESIRRWLPDFSITNPEWLSVERVLVDACSVPALKLEQLTLVQVRRILEVAAAKAQATTKSTPKPKPKKQTMLQPLTDQESIVFQKVREGRMTQADIAREIGISRQRVSAVHRSAKQKIEAACKAKGLTGQSVFGHSGNRATEFAEDATAEWED